MLVSVVICLFLSATVLAAEEEGCVFDGVKVKVGEQYLNSPNCQRITCKGPGSYGGVGCGLVNVSPDQECEYVPKDPSKPYPECCEKYVNCKNKEPLVATAN